ncbi:MAG: hypothetical protein WBP41_16965, partial [Saprospiraceae bacterium]
PKEGHLTFGLVKYEILDTTGFSESNFTEEEQMLAAKRFSKEYEFDLYFNAKKALYVRQDGEITWKTLYDLKRKIAYAYWERKDSTLSEENTRGFIEPLSGYISKLDSSRKFIGLIDSTDIRRNILGFDCHKVLYTYYYYGDVKTHAYVTMDLKVPSPVLFHVGVFREEGLPMEYTFPIGKSMVLIVGAIKFDPGKPNNKMFKIKLDGFKLLELD